MELHLRLRAQTLRGFFDRLKAPSGHVVRREIRACQKSIFDKLSNETHFVGLAFEKAAARRSALAVRRWRTTRTFASREVFLPTYTPPAKMFCT